LGIVAVVVVVVVAVVVVVLAVLVLSVAKQIVLQHFAFHFPVLYIELYVLSKSEGGGVRQ